MSKHGTSAVKDEARQVAVEPERARTIAELKPSRRRFLLYNRSADKLLILLLPVMWFVYYSWRPVYRLQADMPLQFVDAPAAASPAERVREQRQAQAYWKLARMVIRWQYAYGTPLPDDPPPEFRIDQKTVLGPRALSAPDTRAGTASKRVGPVAQTGASDSRLRYWRKLQDMWLRPDVWKARREWSTAWFTGPFLRLYADFQDVFGNLIRIK